MRLDAKKFEDAMKQLGCFVSKKDYRPVLQGIHVLYKAHEDVLTLESCDSFKANIIKLDVVDGDCEDVDMVIEPVKYKATGNVVEINFKDRYITDETMRRISINTVCDLEADYPSLQNIIPKEDVVQEISFGVKNLKDVLKGLCSTDVVTLRIIKDTKPVLITTDYNEKNFKSNTMVISPCRKYV